MSILICFPNYLITACARGFIPFSKYRPRLFQSSAHKFSLIAQWWGPAERAPLLNKKCVSVRCFFFSFFFKAFVNMPRRQRSLLSYLKGTSSDFPDVSLGRFIHLLCCQPKKLKFCLINYCSLSPPLCVSNAMFGARNRSCVRVCCVVLCERKFFKKETEEKGGAREVSSK